MKRSEKAVKYFHAGANCAQAVFAAFADEFGMDEKSAMRLASGFGGGMGRMREVCGAVSGMVLVENLRRGPENPADKAAKDAHYARIQALADAFRAETGSIVCRELLGLPPGPSDPVSAPRTGAYYRKRPCAEMVKLAAELLEKEENAPRS